MTFMQRRDVYQDMNIKGKENRMKRNNTIGIVGRIISAPRLVIDASDWKQKAYETQLSRMRANGKEDVFILRFDGHAIGSEEMAREIREGVEVLVGGSILSENVHNPKPEESKVITYINAEVIAVNNPSADPQNEVELKGRVCRPPYNRKSYQKKDYGKKTNITDFLLAVNTKDGASYIPCICRGDKAVQANELKVGDHVRVYGVYQSRTFKKWTEGKKIPYLRTTHEVHVIKLEVSKEPDRESAAIKEGTGT